MAQAISVLPVSEVAPKSRFVPKMHVSLNVRDVTASVRFYEGFFGVAAHKERPGYANFNLIEPPLKLALNEVSMGGNGSGSLSHLGIQVSTEAEVTAMRERLKAAGLATFDEGDTVCCWARQDKVWATDPDGHAWEVYVLLDEMNQTDDQEFGPHGTAKESSSCGCQTGSPTVCCA